MTKEYMEREIYELTAIILSLKLRLEDFENELKRLEAVYANKYEIHEGN